MKTILAVLLAALMAFGGLTRAHAYYDAAPDRTTVTGNAAG